MEDLEVDRAQKSELFIRPAVFADAAAIAEVRVATWRTAYRGILPEAYLASLSVDDSRRNWEGILAAGGRQGYAYVAIDSAGRLFGFIIGGLARNSEPSYPAELYAIYLLPQYQQHGAGRRLVASLTQRLLREGWSAMLVWVLADNHPARRFYERLGGHALYEKPLTLAGQSYFEQAYGWEDIHPLAEL